MNAFSLFSSIVIAHLPAVCGSSNNENGLAHHLALDDVVQRVRRALERIPRRDARLQLARREPGEQLAQVLLIAPRVPGGKAAPEHADDRATLEQRQVQRYARDVP